jgi:hypothetical protein
LRLDLDDAHPSYRVAITRIVRGLDRDFPGVLQRLLFFTPKAGDRSLGYAGPGAIHLNLFWFAQPIEDLREAARRGTRWRLDGLRWHAAMDEPDHVVTHEFGHCVRIAGGKRAADFSHRLHAEALERPDVAATGYALTDAEELFADTFAAMRLVADPGPQAAALREFLAA